MSPLIFLQIVYKGRNGFAAEGGRRHTALSNLLASLPQHEWTQPFLTSRGKAAVGDGGKGLLTLVYNPTETPPSSPHSPVVYCNLIKLNN